VVLVVVVTQQQTTRQADRQTDKTGRTGSRYALLRCRDAAAWRKPDRTKKKLGKKCTHRPRYALAGVEAKSTLGPRRNRGTCTLEQDDMHAASDHGRRPTTRIKAVCPLEERKAVSLTAGDGWLGSIAHEGKSMCVV
jgi:hypothetical protein